MFFRNPERQEDSMGREGRDYWEMQLSEYWDSGLTIQEYSELKELPYEVSAQPAPASSMVMVDRGEIFSKGEMATK